MSSVLRRPLSIALGAAATAALGGCYYGDVNGASYASAGYACETRYGSGYYDAYDPYAYDDGYGYDCYDGGDYGSGFVQIGFGGGWYDSYYYPGYGLWMFDGYRNRYPLRGHYLNYWGGRRAWWKHHGRRGDGNWNRPGRGDHDGRPGRPGGWNRGDRDGDGKGRPGHRPGRGGGTDHPPTSHTPGAPVGTPSQRPPRDPDAVRPRPYRETIGRDPVTSRRPAIRAPARQAAPAAAPRREPVAARPVQRAPVPEAARAPAPRATAAPVARPERAERPATRAASRGGDRANRMRED
jgi:hypothetical protein